MSRPVSRAAIVSAIVKKDFVEFSRDKLYIFLSLLGMIFFVLIFWFVPDTVDETITLGMTHGGDLGALVAQFEAGAEGSAEGLALEVFDSPEQMQGVIDGSLELWRADEGDARVIRDKEAGDDKPKDSHRVGVQIGIAFPEGFLIDTATGTRTTVKVYADAAVPPEIQTAMKSFVREIAYGITDNVLPVTEPAQENIILGEDRAGDQVSIREKMRPMISIMILMVEVFSLASLISGEVLNRTVVAVLATPAKIGDFLAAKTIYGTVLALAQAFIVLLAIGAFTAENWFALLVILVIASVMFTGIAMAVGAAGKDFMGTLFYAMAFVLPLMIPAFALLLPGTASAWVRVLPTYGLIQMLNGVTAYGRGIDEYLPQLGISVAWLVAIYVAGLFTLKRKVESL